MVPPPCLPPHDCTARSGSLKPCPPPPPPFRSVPAHEGGCFGLAFSRTGALLASGGSDKAVKLWEPATATLTSTLQVSCAGLVVMWCAMVCVCVCVGGWVGGGCMWCRGPKSGEGVAETSAQVAWPHTSLAAQPAPAAPLGQGVARGAGP
jgi:WD40 repeat protein